MFGCGATPLQVWGAQLKKRTLDNMHPTLMIQASFFNLIPDSSTSNLIAGGDFNAVLDSLTDRLSSH